MFPRVRDPYYFTAVVAVYMIWMEAAHGSCSGFAALSRLMAEGTVPSSTFDTLTGDGIHGVVFPDGYLGLDPCDTNDTRRCAPKPPHWTGFDLFQPYRPLNLWSRIVSLQGVQTSAEFLNEFLPQLGRPIAFGPRRGAAVGDPVAVLNRLRANPAGYVLSLFERDLGGAHCVTPYAVLDGQKLADDLRTAIPATGFSLIKIYDSNKPEQERLVEVDRVQNTFRYGLGFLDDDDNPIIYAGAGMYSIPMSVFRGARHAPGPFDLGRWGTEFARFLILGASTVSHHDAAGGKIGWPVAGFTNSYDGALAFLPPADVLNFTNRHDAMLFLPAVNPPVASYFQSSGSNVLIQAAMGWGDIALSFETPNMVVTHQLDSFGSGPDGLTRLGLHTTSPVRGFNAVIASRDSNGPSRIFLLDATTAELTPDLVLERDGLSSLKIRNRSPQPFSFRLSLSGADPNLGRFDQSYGAYTQPPDSTLTLRLPAVNVANFVVRELDTDNDGHPELTDNLPASGVLRGAVENNQVTLRWRRMGLDEILECTSNLISGAWKPVATNVVDDGLDRVAAVTADSPAKFFRLRQATTQCLALDSIPPGPKPNPWETNGFRFEALDGTLTSLPQNTIVSRDGFSGLEVTQTLWMQSLTDCQTISLEVYQANDTVRIEAIGLLGAVVDRASIVGGSGSQQVTLSAPGGNIAFVRIISPSPNAPCLLLKVCGERTTQP